MSRKYFSARSLCDAVAWDRSLLSRSVAGFDVPEISERCAVLALAGNERAEILDLALDICAAFAETQRSHVRLLASKPRLVAGVSGLWSVGQEWLELVRNAEETILFVSPTLDSIAAANMREALSAAYRGNIRLTVLYGSLGKEERTASALATFKEAFPNAELLEWPTRLGFLHAKVICADDSTIYLGSANLTEFGWEKNIELGVTVSGPASLPLVEYCHGLLDLARSAIVRY
jgi:phosphatidylserine/phosphatidylglycerophosphate/cardiolipin synthase-like enzyme